MFIICEGVFDPFLSIYYIQDCSEECYSGVKIFEGISSESHNRVLLRSNHAAYTFILKRYLRRIDAP